MKPIPRSHVEALLDLNRNFDVGDRVSQRPKRSSLGCKGSPKPLPSNHGEILERTQVRIRTPKAKAGFVMVSASVVRWDGSSQGETVEDKRLIHESEYPRYIEHIND